MNVKLPRTERLPCPRSGHSASLYNGQMYVFGGKNDDSEKLNDLWSFNIHDYNWREIKVKNPETIPVARSGHTTDIYRGYLVLFGGIQDVTKELNDVVLYSFKTNEWICCQEDVQMSPRKGRVQNYTSPPD